MRNRWLINLLLLILVVGLGTLMRRDLEQERQVATLTGLLPESIMEITISRSDQATIRLVQGMEGWRMEAPFRVPANTKRIDELAGIAATPVYRSLPAGTDRKQLGLDTGALSLTLNDLVLRFGGLDPIAQHRYVAIGERVYLIGDGFYHHLIAGAEDYVDRKLLPSGFRADTGTLGGRPLSDEELADLNGLVAEVVEPLGSELIGRPLSVTSDNNMQTLRFLVSEDGLGWARLDLRLRYLLAAPPAWAVAEPAGSQDTGDPQAGDPGW